MTTNLRENSFIITITSLTTVTFIALIATLIMALVSSEDACVTPMMIIDLILVLIIFFVYFCKTSEATETTKLTENVPVLSPPSYNDICKESKSKEDELNKKKLAAVSQYVHVVMSPYLKETEVMQLITNITMWMESDEPVLTAITTDGRLTTLDLRHFAWNIGERFKWKGVKRASFLKLVFPVEMRELEVETIRRNLRQNGTCLIELDIPDKGCYEFFKE